MEETKRLAQFVARHPYDDLPRQARREAVRSLLNWLGCALGGSSHESVGCCLEALSPFFGPPQATLLGRGRKCDVMSAALINGLASHVLDFDDTHLATVIHPSGPVAAALLALAEYRPLSGREFLHAFVLGVEVSCRLGRAVYPSHYDVGWHITATTGVFGAAAAAGRALGLDPDRMTWALGIAATQAAGLREMFGTMCKPFHVGRAAQGGLMAALLAAGGFTSSEKGIEARRGFAHVLAAERDLAVLTDGLGESWEVTCNTYKPFACGIVVHPAIDGCLQLRREGGFAPEEIESVDLAVHPLVLELTGIGEPKTGLEGKFSVYHSAAVALVRGAAGVQEYTDEAVRDEKVVSLRKAVSARADGGLREDEARVSLRLKDGRLLERHVEHAVGSLARPLSDAELDAKFRGLATTVLSCDEAEYLLRLGRSLERLPQAAALAQASVSAYEPQAGAGG